MHFKIYNEKNFFTITYIFDRVTLNFVFVMTKLRDKMSTRNIFSKF